MRTDIQDVLLDLALHGYIEHCPEPEFGSLEVARQRNRDAERLNKKFWEFMCTKRAEKRVALRGVGRAIRLSPMP